MKNTVLIILGVALLVAGGLFAVQYRAGVADDPQIKVPTASEMEATLGEINRFTGLTNALALCGTTSGLFLSTSTGRQYVGMTNNSTTTDIYIGFSQHAVDRKGIFLGRSGGSLEINLDNLFTGSLFCIASSTAQLGIIYK
jgi:hypothetical protein